MTFGSSLAGGMDIDDNKYPGKALNLAGQVSKKSIPVSEIIKPRLSKLSFSAFFLIFHSVIKL